MNPTVTRFNISEGVIGGITLKSLKYTHTIPLNRR